MACFDTVFKTEVVSSKHRIHANLFNTCVDIYTFHKIVLQDLANKSTPLSYSSKTRRFGNYLCMNLRNIRLGIRLNTRLEV